MDKIGKVIFGSLSCGPYLIEDYLHSVSILIPVFRIRESKLEDIECIRDLIDNGNWIINSKMSIATNTNNQSLIFTGDLVKVKFVPDSVPF